MNKKVWERGIIIADDLTGAMDAGVQCLRTNEVEVIIDSRKFQEELIKKHKILAINTQSRQINSENAKKIILKIVESLGKIDSSFFLYKKVDSTLRGNFVGEIWKLFQLYKPKVVIFAPAIPSLGRKVIEGKLFVDGRNLKDSPYIKEITGSSVENIASIFKESWPACNVVSVPPLVSFEELNTLIERNIDLIIADAYQEDHLEYLAQVGVRLEKQGVKVLWSGASGLLKGLQAQCVFNKIKIPEFKKPTKSPFLIVSGSTREIADKQITSAVDSDPRSFSISCQYVPDQVQTLNKSTDIPLFYWKTNKLSEVWDTVKTERLKNIIDKARNSLLGGENVYIQPVIDGKKPISDYVSVVISQVVKRILLSSRGDKPSLILVGGDTANMILRNLGVTKVSLMQEIEPYIPLGTILNGLVCGSLLVTKAGGFGDSETVKRIIHKLARIKS